MSPARAAQAAVARRATAPARRVEAPRRPELRVVDPEARPRPHIGRRGAILAGGLFAALFALAGLQTMIINSQAHLDDLNKQITAEETRGGALRLQLADLQSPQRITTAASERLGMVAPAGIGYLQPAATDEARARFDGATTPTTAATAKGSSTSTATTTPKTATTTPRTTPTTAPRTPTTTARAGTTPTTVRSATTPTTTRTSPTSTAPSGSTR